MKSYVQRKNRSKGRGTWLTVLEDRKIADFEKNWESNSQNLKKPSALSIEENNTLLWAKQIFKTKTMRWMELKTKIKSFSSLD
jgi:ATP-dependent RNA helicase DeaD